MQIDELHPGVVVALRRAEMDETEVAKAIAAGELTSPQRFANSTYFALRITGTGAAYRHGLDEYVWRDPALYLNEHFLDRCRGLPVIIEHPPGLMMTSAEYERRNVGSIVHPYVPVDAPDEVWGVARIIDEDTAKFLEDNVASTSPAVVFGDLSVNEVIDIEDGKHLLIEGKPTLLDHLALCVQGVWDKQGPPSGVEVEQVEDDADSRLDAALAAVDGILRYQKLAKIAKKLELIAQL